MELLPTFLDSVFSVAVGGFWQLTHQRVMGVSVLGAQALHLSGCIRTAPPGQLPWDEQEHHKMVIKSEGVKQDLSFQKTAVRVGEY